MSLLNKIKKIKPKNLTKNNNEFLEVCIAWAKGDVRICQITKFLKKEHGNSTYSAIVMGLREAVRRGLLVENKKGGNNG